MVIVCSCLCLVVILTKTDHWSLATPRIAYLLWMFSVSGTRDFRTHVG